MASADSRNSRGAPSGPASLVRGGVRDVERTRPVGALEPLDPDDVAPADVASNGREHEDEAVRA